MKFIFSIVILLFANTAYAERGEFQLQFAPTLTIAPRDGGTYLGPGGLFVASYGLRDWLGLNGEVLCDRFSRLFTSTTQANSTHGQIAYHSTRCSFGSAIFFQIGTWNITNVSIGLAYRFDVQSGRELGNTAGVFLDTMGNTVKNALIATGTFAFERRFLGPFSAGIRARLTLPIVGAPRSEIDVSLAAVFGMYFFL